MVRLAMGQVDVAVNLLTKALASDPDMVDGYTYLALAYARMGRMPEAQATIAKASGRFPERSADLRRYLTELKGETPVAKASAASGAPDPHAGLATPGDGAPQRSGTMGRGVLRPDLALPAAHPRPAAHRGGAGGGQIPLPGRRQDRT